MLVGERFKSSLLLRLEEKTLMLSDLFRIYDPFWSSDSQSSGSKVRPFSSGPSTRKREGRRFPPLQMINDSDLL